MMYTMRAGVDRQLRDKIARSILYGTGVLVAAAIAIAPFTGNNTFWSGRGKSTNNASDSSASGGNGTTSSSKMRTNTTQPPSSSNTANVPSAQSGVSKINSSSATGALPVASGTTSTAPLQSTPVVGRGGDSTTTTTTKQDPTPDTITSPTGPAPAALPITYCTPTTSIDPLLTANPVCVN